jgi:hypothetical protein
VFNGLRWIVRTVAFDAARSAALGVVQQQGERWTAAGVFAALVDGLRILLRRAVGRTAHLSAAILDSRI